MSSAGILPRALQYIFNAHSDNTKRQYSLSFFEIYNEKIFDLLDDADNKKKRSSSRGETSTGYAPFSFLQMNRVVV
jgi:hypothetical protein